MSKIWVTRCSDKKGPTLIFFEGIAFYRVDLPSCQKMFKNIFFSILLPYEHHLVPVNTPLLRK